jgi:hypothetical protein
MPLSNFSRNGTSIFSLDIPDDIIDKYMPHLQRANIYMQDVFEFDISFDEIYIDDTAKKIIQLFIDQPKLPTNYIDAPFTSFLATYKFMNLYIMPEEEEHIRYAKNFMYIIMSRLENFCAQLHKLKHEQCITYLYDSDLDDMLTHKFGSYTGYVYIYGTKFLNFTQGHNLSIEEISDEIYKAYLKMPKMGQEMEDLVDRIGDNFYVKYCKDMPMQAREGIYKPSGYFNMSKAY